MDFIWNMSNMNKFRKSKCTSIFNYIWVPWWAVCYCQIACTLNTINEDIKVNTSNYCSNILNSVQQKHDRGWLYSENQAFSCELQQWWPLRKFQNIKEKYWHVCIRIRLSRDFWVREVEIGYHEKDATIECEFHSDYFFWWKVGQVIPG